MLEFCVTGDEKSKHEFNVVSILMSFAKKKTPHIFIYIFCRSRPFHNLNKKVMFPLFVHSLVQSLISDTTVGYSLIL